MSVRLWESLPSSKTLHLQRSLISRVGILPGLHPLSFWPPGGFRSPFLRFWGKELAFEVPLEIPTLFSRTQLTSLPLGGHRSHFLVQGIQLWPRGEHGVYLGVPADVFLSSELL